MNLLKPLPPNFRHALHNVFPDFAARVESILKKQHLQLSRSGGDLHLDDGKITWTKPISSKSSNERENTSTLVALTEESGLISFENIDLQSFTQRELIAQVIVLVLNSNNSKTVKLQKKIGKECIIFDEVVGAYIRLLAPNHSISFEFDGEMVIITKSNHSSV